MKAAELRIGNLLTLNGGCDFEKVASIHSDETIRFFNEAENDTHGCYRLTAIMDILLTEDLLLKFGFKKEGDFYIHYGNDSIFTLNHEFHLYEGSEYQLTKKPLIFVHTLQNLYFALTGEELIIK